MTSEWDWEQVLRWCEVEARRILGPGAGADDAAQEAALRAWRRHGQCEARVNRRPWVAAIARREALRVAAGGRAELSLADQNERAGSGGLGAGTVDRLDVWRAMETLGPAERKLLGLRYWADLTQAEAAKRLDLPEGTAKVRLHRLRTTMRGELAA